MHTGLMWLRSKFGHVFERLARIRRILIMRLLLYTSLSPVGKKEEFLFWVPGGMPLMLHLEGSIAVALKLRHHNVHAIICDGIFSACVRREITDQIPLEMWRDTCNTCKKACSDTLTELGIKHSFIGNYVSEDELNIAKNATRKVTWANVETLQYRNVSVGRNVKSAVLRYLKGHDIPDDAELLQEYAFSGFVCAIAAANAFEKRKPTRIFMSHGVYVDWGPALHTALEMSVPVTAWMASYLPARFYFRNVSDGVHIDMHNMSSFAWNEISSIALTTSQNERLDKYLSDRYVGDASFDMKYFKPYIGKRTDVLTRYKLDGDRPIWGIMAHINWDTVSDYSPMLYESFNMWMEETLEVIKDVSDVQWLVKVHPAEAWDNPESGVEKLIRKKFPRLPANITLLPADENISPLDFFGLLDGAVTVYGTAGLELAMHGKPVILAGDAHYGKKSFTYDPDSIKTYKALLHKASQIPVLTDVQVSLAKQYAYCYFILRQIPVSVVVNPNAKWWSFQFSKRERLMPGKDSAIDFICERLLDGKDFIMSPSLEIESNNYMNQKK